jgi:Pectate lyase superfamily protein
MKISHFFKKLVLILLAYSLSHTASFAQIINGGWIPGVTATASSTQNGNPLSNLTSDAGLSETIQGSGVYQLSANQGPWASGTDDINSLVEFDLGTAQTVNRFRVWNCNEPNYNYRGFKDVVIQYTNDPDVQDGTRIWKTTPQNFIFALAPAANGYLGQEFTFNWPINARYIRFWCDANYGVSERSSLSKVRFYAGGTAVAPSLTNDIWPADARVTNVKDAPYNAIGDGVADDYNAIQSAIRDYEGTMRMIYLPAGTYRVSQPLRCRNSYEPAGVQRNGQTWIRGASRDTTVIKLDNGVLTNLSQPKHLLYTGYFVFADGSGNSADWFNITVTDLTLNTGSNNPAAKGLGFYSNNTGIVRDVTIRSGDGQGLIGLDCDYAGQNGPNMIKNVLVDGFATGFLAGGPINSQTLEDVTLNNQTGVAIQNNGQVLSIRKLITSGSVPAIRSPSTEGFITLIDSTFNGAGAAPGTNAIENTGTMLIRDVTSSGFTKTLNNIGGPGGTRQISGFIHEYLTGSVLSLFPNEGSTLRLPVEETPPIIDGPPETWSNVRNYRLTKELDIGRAAERAIASGATTIYFPTGRYLLDSSIELTNNLQHLSLLFSTLYQNTPNQASNSNGLIYLSDGTSPTVTIDNGRESFTNRIKLRTGSERTLSCRNLGGFDWYSDSTKKGRMFIENCVGDLVNLDVGSSFWARGLNLESGSGGLAYKMARNNGGKAWILGYKTEGQDTLLTTTFGGQTELLGGLNYSYNSLPGTPMMQIQNSRVSLTMAEVNFGGVPFDPVVVENRETTTRSLTGGSQVPTSAGGSRIALYSSKRPLTSAKITRLPSSQMQLTWNTIPLRTYFIQSSTDLINWQNISMTTIQAGSTEFVKTFVTTATEPKKFYRVALDDTPPYFGPN